MHSSHALHGQGGVRLRADRNPQADPLGCVRTHRLRRTMAEAIA